MSSVGGANLGSSNARSVWKNSNKQQQAILHTSKMGKCLTIAKLIGIGSLGISSGAFLVSSLSCVPKAAKTLQLADLKAKVSKLITSLRLGFWGLGSLASYLLYQAYARSPAYGKHPYLLYAALAFPIALTYNYYFAFSDEQKLVSDSEEKVIYRTEKKVVEKVVSPEEDKSPLDNSVYNDLGSRDPKVEETEIEVEVPTVSKVELSEETFKSLLSTVSENHLYTGAILGVGFLLGSVGYIGDNLK